MEVGYIDSSLQCLINSHRAPLQLDWSSVPSWMGCFHVQREDWGGEREGDTRAVGCERDGGVGFRGPVKSVALCFMKRVKKRTLKVSIFQ